MDNKSNLVFLNTTNGPALSPEAVKKMRGHITKSNFAKRRQRIAEDPNVNKQKKNKIGKKRLRESTDVVPFRSLSDPAYHNSDLTLLILLTCLNPPTTNPSEAAWVDLFTAEPALVEATMAIGLRHWSPQPPWQLQADVCSSKALTSIIQQIGCQQTHTDGFLAAVMTMAFGARLMHASSIWDVHVDGLVQIVNDRRLRGIREPGWFGDILVVDAVNYIFNFPRFWHKKVIDAMGESGGLRVRQVAEICEGILALRRSIKMYYEGRVDPRVVAQDIEQESTLLRDKTRKLRTSKKNKYVLATSLTLELVLCLLWPPTSQSSHTHSLAKELQRTTSQLPKAPCPYMDLTSCQVIIGAVAAEHGSTTRLWFVEKLTRAACAMQDRGWSEEPFEILGRVLRADDSLMRWFGREVGRTDIAQRYEDVSRQILGVSLEQCCVAV